MASHREHTCSSCFTASSKEPPRLSASVLLPSLAGGAGRVGVGSLQRQLLLDPGELLTPSWAEPELARLQVPFSGFSTKHLVCLKIHVPRCPEADVSGGVCRPFVCLPHSLHFSGRWRLNFLRLRDGGRALVLPFLKPDSAVTALSLPQPRRRWKEKPLLSGVPALKLHSLWPRLLGCGLDCASGSPSLSFLPHVSFWEGGCCHKATAPTGDWEPRFAWKDSPATLACNVGPVACVLGAVSLQSELNKSGTLSRALGTCQPPHKTPA